MNFMGFRKTYSNTITYFTKNRFEIEIRVSGKTSICSLEEGSVTLKEKCNFNNTQMYETSKTVEYAGIAQSIVIPPRTISLITALLDLKKFKGKVNLNSEIGFDKEMYGYKNVSILQKEGSIGEWMSLGSTCDDDYKQAKLDRVGNLN
ncbi:hypothetical protein BF15_30680 [Bacillus thuringiensis]|nr:hypothetical protein BF15_30680 [Bacillus thuringiensis]